MPTQTREKPIIFSTEMVKAILDDLKSMTRRTYGLEKVNKNLDEWEYKGIEDLAPQDIHLFRHIPTDSFLNIRCPYGQVGSRLWVRETWRIESFMDGEPILFSFKDGQTQEDNSCDELNYEEWYERVCTESTNEARVAFERGLVRQDEGDCYLWDIGKSPCRWRPSIFMPRWASRIDLEITSIRVERLNEVTEEDVKAEGITLHWIGNKEKATGRELIYKYMMLWNSINAKRGYPWKSNPWVWVIEFRRIKS